MKSNLQLVASSKARVASSTARIHQTLARIRVVHADPQNPPQPPEGAHAVTVKDASGNVISYGWCAPSVDRETFHAQAWALADALEATPAYGLRAVP